MEKGTHCARVAFAPTPQEQAAFSAAGLAGDFAVEYDVARRDVVGDVEVRRGGMGTGEGEREPVPKPPRLIP